jgi:hypothetical protein
MVCNKEFEIRVELLHIIECCDGKAETIFNHTCNVLQDKNIPTENWIGLIADTCDTMFG